MPVRLNPIHIISLGAGVQSSTLALMAHHGEILPKPSYAVFADTHAEPRAVYSWLDRLEGLLSFPVVRVSAGSLIDAALTHQQSESSGKTWMKRTLPVYYDNDGTRGMAQRRCTYNFKIRPLRQFSHKFIQDGVVQWIGISSDEAGRMRDSEVAYIQNRYPLIERSMSRNDCLQWMRDHGYPEPPKSSCVFCPFHSDRQWLQLKREDPQAFQLSVDLEKQIQAEQRRHEENPYIGFFHKTLKPLDEVEFRENQNSFGFMNDCSGSCGV